MSISENIAKYRKQKGYTQEKLGEMLGVSNQAVSKWESAVSMPDIMLLPKIADILGITLNELYGIAVTGGHGDRNERIQNFTSETQKMIRNHLFSHLFEDTQALRYMVRFDRDSDGNAHISSGYNIGIVPYTVCGASFISENLSILSSDYTIQKGSKLFESMEIASAMKKLCDTDVREILGYLYAKAFEKTRENEDIFDYAFTIPKIAAACGMDKDAVMNAVEKLISLHIVEINREEHSQYVFKKTRAIETAVTFQTIESLMRGEMHFGCGYIVGHGTL